MVRVRIDSVLRIADIRNGGAESKIKLEVIRARGSSNTRHISFIR